MTTDRKFIRVAVPPAERSGLTALAESVGIDTTVPLLGRSGVYPRIVAAMITVTLAHLAEFKRAYRQPVAVAPVARRGRKAVTK